MSKSERKSLDALAAQMCAASATDPHQGKPSQIFTDSKAKATILYPELTQLALKIRVYPANPRTKLIVELRLLARFSDLSRSWNFNQLAAAHIVNIAIDRDRSRHQWMVANAPDIAGDAFRLVFDSKPIDVVTLT